jgi:hypothetical protein
METQQETQENTQSPEEQNGTAVQQEQETEQHSDDAEVATEQNDEQPKLSKTTCAGNRNGFVHGLAVGLGFGCIATFVIMWIAVFFTPLIPRGATYENLLSVFIFPLIYLLAVGLIALTAGIVREYYAIKSNP